MSEIQRPLSTTKRLENKNDGALNTDDAERKAECDKIIYLEKGLFNKLLNDDAITVRTSSMEKSVKIDWTIQSNTPNNDLKVETLPKQDKSTVINSNDRKMKRKVQCKSLSEYLHEHERFLRLIEHTSRLKIHEQKKLDIQLNNLNELRNRLTKEIEENNRKSRYEKNKQMTILNKRRANLSRRVEEAQLKESRKPLVQTTFFVSIKPLTFKSQLAREKTTTQLFESSSLATITPSKSTSHISTRNSTRESQFRANVASQTTKTTYSDVLCVEHELKEMKKHPKEPSNNIGKSLEELIMKFVENSKSSWTND